jgi:hypothetical protein
MSRRQEVVSFETKAGSGPRMSIILIPVTKNREQDEKLERPGQRRKRCPGLNHEDR